MHSILILVAVGGGEVGRGSGGGGVWHGRKDRINITSVFPFPTVSLS